MFCRNLTSVLAHRFLTLSEGSISRLKHVIIVIVWSADLIQTVIRSTIWDTKPFDWELVVTSYEYHNTRREISGACPLNISIPGVWSYETINKLVLREWVNSLVWKH